MPVPLLTAGALALPSLIKTGIGIGQLFKSKKYDVERPDYEIPQSILEAVDSARAETRRTEMPGQSRLEEKLRQRSSQAMETAKDLSRSSSDVISALTDISLGEMDAISDVEAKSEVNRLRNVRELENKLAQLSQYENQMWMKNEYEPYMQSMDAARRLRDSGSQNLFSGLSNVSGIAAEMIPLLFGKGDNTSTGMNSVNEINADDYNIDDIYDVNDDNAINELENFFNIT